MSTLNKSLRRHCLLVAHGSRLDKSNDEIRALAGLLGDRSDEFSQFEYAILEMAQPSINEGLRRCIAQGANEIVVLPYSLSAGRHVTTDIPEQIEGIKKQFPQVTIRLNYHIGANAGMADFILAHILGHERERAF